jgi:hypothetical protein
MLVPVALAAAVVATVSIIGTGLGTANAAAQPAKDQLDKIASDAARPVQERIDAQLKLAPGGTQISANEIAWDGGKMVMSFPAQGQVAAPVSSSSAIKLQAKNKTTAAKALAAQGSGSSAKPVAAASDVVTTQSMNTHGCPTVVFGNDWYCFYDGTNWGGRRLQWSDRYCSVSGGNSVDFSGYGFRSKTSSWVNGGGFRIAVYGNPQFLWDETDHTTSSWVGAANNDRAFGFSAC